MRLLIIVMASFAAVALAITVGWSMFTRYASAPGSASRRVPCGFRAGHRRWLLGTLSYEADRLVYRAPAGLSRHREHHWQRCQLRVGLGETLEGQQISKRWRGSHVVVVQCAYGDQSFELAISEGRYTALRSWVEAVPPGWNVNVA